MTLARIRTLGPIAALLCFGCLAPPALAHDPDALWKIVHERCVPDLADHADPSPCLLVEPGSGPGGGFAVLKDRDGVAQLLVIPTIRHSGMDDPGLLDPARPNYWAEAWKQRLVMERPLSRRLKRDEVGLAINSVSGRSQNQLHIHVDCLRPDIRDALRARKDGIGERWAPLGVELDGHPYLARRIEGEELGTRNPFQLLAEGVEGANADMAMHTLVVTGARFADGRDGFILLDDHADGLDRGHGEELLDHDCHIAQK